MRRCPSESPRTGNRTAAVQIKTCWRIADRITGNSRRKCTTNEWSQSRSCWKYQRDLYRKTSWPGSSVHWSICPCAKDNRNTPHFACGRTCSLPAPIILTWPRHCGMRHIAYQNRGMSVPPRGWSKSLSLQTRVVQFGTIESTDAIFPSEGSSVNQFSQYDLLSAFNSRGPRGGV